MRHIHNLALIATARGCGFGSLAIVTAMAGCAFDAALALKVGGFGFTLMAAILMLKAEIARWRPYNRTEVWILLPKDQRPDQAYAQRVITEANREAFLRFGRYTAATAIGLWALQIIVSFSSAAA